MPPFSAWRAESTDRSIHLLFNRKFLVSYFYNWWTFQSKLQHFLVPDPKFARFSLSRFSSRRHTLSHCHTVHSERDEPSVWWVSPRLCRWGRWCSGSRCWCTDVSVGRTSFWKTNRCLSLCGRQFVRYIKILAGHNPHRPRGVFTRRVLTAGRTSRSSAAWSGRARTARRCRSREPLPPACT